MKAMIYKHKKGFEPMFFDVNTLDDLLNALCEYGYPPMQINIEDDEHDDPRMGIELFDERDDSMHTIDDDVSYAVCLNLDLPNPDNPELIVMSGKTLISTLENLDWKEENSE